MECVEMGNLQTSPLAFVMAHRNITGRRDLDVLKKTIRHILNQTDPNWQLYIVDDASSYQPAIDYLRVLTTYNKNQIALTELAENRGPGYARNIGIQAAVKRNNPVIMFIDSDDLVHKERVRVTREIFHQNKTDLVVYSGFIPITEEGKVIEEHQLTPSIQEIRRALSIAPQGLEVWKTIGIETGYLNLTSATSVSTNVAVQHPFPSETISEDSHTWLRYSAGGTPFKYAPLIPVFYRTKLGGEGSASREIIGREFYHEKMRVDCEGFSMAIELACQRGVIDNNEAIELEIAFLFRLAKTMAAERIDELVEPLLSRAYSINIEIAKAFHNAYPTLIDIIPLKNAA